MGIHEAFAAADLTISQSIRSVAGLLQRPGLLHIGFDDVCASCGMAMRGHFSDTAKRRARTVHMTRWESA